MHSNSTRLQLTGSIGQGKVASYCGSFMRRMLRVSKTATPSKIKPILEITNSVRRTAAQIANYSTE